MGIAKTNDTVTILHNKVKFWQCSDIVVKTQLFKCKNQRQLSNDKK